MPDYAKLTLPGNAWMVVWEHLEASAGSRASAGWLFSMLNGPGVHVRVLGKKPVTLELPDDLLDLVRSTARELGIPLEADV